MGRPQKYKIGDRINCWTVIGPQNYPAKLRECRCDCGTIKLTRFHVGMSMSCGCQRGPLLVKSYAEKRARGIHHPSRQHGLSQTREYQSYKHMVSRCTNPDNDSFHLYGGRGITVCAKWLGVDGFENFLVNMGPRPPKTSLDRINPDGNYDPSNCRWADNKTQIANRRVVVQVSLSRLQKLEEFARSMGVKL